MNHRTRTLGIGLLVLSSLPLLQQQAAMARGTGLSCLSLSSMESGATVQLDGATYNCADNTPLSGTVQISVDGVFLASVASEYVADIRNLSHDGFTFFANSLAQGPHTFTETFSPSAPGIEDAAATQTVTVAGAVSSTALAFAVGPHQSSLTLTATVTGPQGTPGTPTGTVTFWDNGNRINTRSLTNGGCTYVVENYPNWTGSPHRVWATYSGDDTFSISRSATVAIQAPVVG